MNVVENPGVIDLYTKISINPHYLEVPSEMPFMQSPLHIAALEGRTDLALEILRLKPSLGKKLNLDGLSPLHLALDNRHTNTVKRLVKHDPDLVRVPGREGITLLHYVVETEEIDLLIYFLLVCPLSIFDLTARDETVVHIAVRNNNFRAFEVLLGWARRTENTTVFGWRNEDGNNVMHLAALTNQPRVMKSLIQLNYVHVNKKNLEGRTALDILDSESVEHVEARKILVSAGAKEGSSLVDDASGCENYLKSNRTMKEYFLLLGAYLEYCLSREMRSVILVVAVLIVNASLQATISSSFVISHNDTTPVFPSVTSVYNDTTSTNSTTINVNKITPMMKHLYKIVNLLAFCLAMGTIVVLTYNPLQPFILPFLLLPLSLYWVGYYALIVEIYPNTEVIFILLAFMALCSLVFLIIIPWETIRWKGLIEGDNYCENDLDEARSLIFGSVFMNQGPILTWMAKMKASR